MSEELNEELRQYQEGLLRHMWMEGLGVDETNTAFEQAWRGASEDWGRRAQQEFHLFRAMDSWRDHPPYRGPVPIEHVYYSAFGRITVWCSPAGTKRWATREVI